VIKTARGGFSREKTTDSVFCFNPHQAANLFRAGRKIYLRGGTWIDPGR
jgi:hypothetical protein